MRQKQITTATMEDIVSYECNYPGKFVKILIGNGTQNTLGEFIPYPEQGYECITLQAQEFDQLMAAGGGKPAGVFRKEDLWPFVDTLRPIIAQDKLLGRVR